MRYTILFFLLLSYSLIGQEASPKKELIKNGKSYEYILYHDNGQIAQKGTISNQKLEGVWVRFSPEGKKLSQGTFTHGKKTGKWFFWNEKGLIEAYFKDNKLVSAVSWNEGQSLAEN